MQRIPYGCTRFKDIMKEGMYYVDKTMYIPSLEEAGNFLIFLRPRRFGKSLFVDMLKSYYDIRQAGEFEGLFGKLFIGNKPTAAHNKYLIMHFNFSEIEKTGSLGDLQENFNRYCRLQLDFVLRHYESYFDAEAYQSIKSLDGPCQKMRLMSQYLAEKGQRVYLLIDEYDNFANRILAEGMAGVEKYRKLTHGTGFFRDFFTFIKGATTGQDSAIERIFITGVSPITLDDVTSGFNIVRNISTNSCFNGMLGFTVEDVRRMLSCYCSELQDARPLDTHLEIMKQWYDNYCFCVSGCEKTLFNTDMVLYYVNEYALSQGTLPREMADANVKTDYERLRHLISLDKKLNGNLSVLCALAEENAVEAELVSMFGVEQFIQKDAFISFLYYLGLVTILGQRGLKTLFTIPNQTIRVMIFSYIAGALNELSDPETTLRPLLDKIYAMGTEGLWRPALEAMAEKVQHTLSIRDLIIKEKGPQLLHLVYMGLAKVFIVRSEMEMNLGYSDLYLMPDSRYVSFVRHAYILEFKYLTPPKGRRKCTQESIDRALAEAKAQLESYRSDKLLQRQLCGTQLHLIALVYCGAKLLAMGEY